MKRKHVESNIYSLENGNFLVDLHFTNSIGQRQRIRRTCESLSLAKKARRELRARLQVGLPNPLFESRITLKEAIDHALQEKVIRHQRRNRHLSANDLPKSYADMIRIMSDIEVFFGSEFPLERIDDSQVDRFTTFLFQRPKRRYHNGRLSTATINRTLTQLKFLLRVSHQKGFIESVPYVQLFREEGRRELEIDLPTFIQVVNDMPPAPFPHRALLLVALNTGQRASDLLSMTFCQIKKDHIEYRSSKTGRQSIKAPLLEVTRKAVAELRRWSHRKKIFINPRTRKPITDVRRKLTNSCKKLGIPRFTLHHIRHLATTVLLEYTNGDRDLVKRIIGWSSMEMVDRYGHIGSRAIPAFQKINADMEKQLKM